MSFKSMLHNPKTMSGQDLTINQYARGPTLILIKACDATSLAACSEAAAAPDTASYWCSQQCWKVASQGASSSVYTPDAGVTLMHLQLV